MTKEKLTNRFITVRKQTEQLCSSLKIEDYSVQPEVFVSPPKWHLAHSTWFFEQFVLSVYDKNYIPFNEDYGYLFNSYYNNIGDKLLRVNRGLMTRPTVDAIMNYRKTITHSVLSFLSNTDISKEVLDVLEIGLNHEEQHQELLVYDIKYILGNQVLFPEVDIDLSLRETLGEEEFIKIEEGVYEIGYKEDGFCFDNELGVHKVYLNQTEISNQLVTNEDYISFIEAGGYKDFNLWHAEGWDYINQQNINAPLYWFKRNGDWYRYSFDGLVKINPKKPVIHISYYEAYAYAEWKGMRLPTEFEWEIASKHFFHGQLWEWTSSSYQPYPGFKKADGGLGEYNGKFMVNQQVLRGGSIASPEGHVRPTYRNFFHPNLRWMYSGIRLVK